MENTPKPNASEQMCSILIEFEIEGVWADAAVLGSQSDITVGGTTWRICFPHVGSEWGFPKPIGPWSGDKESPDAASVNILRLEATMPAALLLGPDLSVHSQGGVAAMKDVERTASGIVADLLTWVRSTLEHTWLNVRDVRIRGWRIVDSVGRDIAVLRDVIRASMHAAPWLDKSRLKEIVSHIENGERPPDSRTLLADAHFYGLHSVVAFHPLGVLLAAVACEIAIKETLRAHATVEQQALVDLVIDNPREVTLAAASLFDKGLLAVAGASLREDDKELYKQIDKLFQRRNKFAHAGEPHEETIVPDLLSAATRALNYLDALTVGSN